MSREWSVDQLRSNAVARFVEQIVTRRAAIGLVGVAAASTLSALGLGPDASAKKNRKRRKKRRLKKKKRRRKKRKKRCKSPKGQCGTQKRGFPQALDYGNGSIKPSRSQKQLNADVAAAYDRWKARYLVREDPDAEGDPVFRVALGKPGTDKHNQTVSEGQGYGMIIVAIMAGYDKEAREIFDGLWRFRLAHPSTIDPRLMGWKVPALTSGDDNSAFDGDADIAYGLLLADAQWGSDGPIDYLGEAQTVIAGIKESTIGPESNLPMLGDWVEPNGLDHNQNTPRTSDFMPGHFRAFGQATGDDDWVEVITASQNVIEALQQGFSQNANPDGPELTGLLPDFAIAGPQPAPPDVLEGLNDGFYYYNACRDPWRLATDALLNGDPTSAEQAAKIAIWANSATGGNAQAIEAGYKLDGTSLGELADYFTTVFAAPIGVAAMVDPSLQDWLDAIYDEVRDVQENYYEDTVTLLCLLVMSGNFWTPPT